MLRNEEERVKKKTEEARSRARRMLETKKINEEKFIRKQENESQRIAELENKRARIRK